LTKPLHQLTVSDIHALVGNVRERKTIEYKREMPARSAEEKVKFLAAVSAMANTAARRLGMKFSGLVGRTGVSQARKIDDGLCEYLFPVCGPSCPLTACP
jgi:hypothetical protein